MINVCILHTYLNILLIQYPFPEKWLSGLIYRLGPEGSRVKKFNLILLLSDRVNLQTCRVFNYRNDIIYNFRGTKLLNHSAAQFFYIVS